ncbi:MAG: hypothetical protein IT293_16480 [Deltaproteobacteria bacterium]|nr:hypothetical protein [Deltaproteobacteria bacterium]
MTDTTLFPSTQWFEALARRMDQDEAGYRELGPLECTMVVQVEAPAGTQLYEVGFDGFKTSSVRKLANLKEATSEHFVLEASLETWREMIENIRANAGPDLTHTLNYLTFPDDPMRVSGPDQLEVDAFYRYNQSLQRFFNGAAEVPTAFAS